MRLLLQTTDPVLLSFTRAVLADASIAVHVADQYVSAVEGALAIFPRRVHVTADTFLRARRALINAGLSAELASDPDADPEPRALQPRSLPVTEPRR